MRQVFTHSCHAAVAVLMTLLAAAAEDSTIGHPLGSAERDVLAKRFREILKSTPSPETRDEAAVSAHSRRGDSLFFLREYEQAVAEYRAMVKLDPKLDASHWRLGIALYFADQHDAAAKQFDKYHSFDDVDRENGIWRFLCHYRAFGKKRAAKELLRYDKDDREPFPIVYQLFDGSITPEEALRKIPNSLPAIERDKRLFYTELYIGLLKTVQDDTEAARKTLGRAVSRKWPRTAGFGPSYMWHVARLQFEELAESEGRPNVGN